MRSDIVFYLNGKRKSITGDQALLSLSDYLRYEQSLTGTKVVCAEGDCGACTVLIGKSQLTDGKEFEYVPVNSCITFLYLLDGCHIVSVEDLGTPQSLSDVQTCMVDNHGAQCGYCTPGFICSMTALEEDAKKNQWKLDEQKVKNYLTGNLCRCTGYEGIIKAGLALDIESYESLNLKYETESILADLHDVTSKFAMVKTSSGLIYIPTTFDEALDVKSKENITIVSGATDLGVLRNKGKFKPTNILSLGNIKELYEIKESESEIEVGAKANLHQVEDAFENDFPEFSKLIHIFASPQIKNKGTLVGNVANGSPIGDSLPFLMAANCKLNICSNMGERSIELENFFKGYKDFDIKDGEIIKSISVPKTSNEFKLYKTSVRKDLDISAVTFACQYRVEGGKVTFFKLVLGGVGPYVLTPLKTQAAIKDQPWSAQTFANAAKLLNQDIKPLSDLRGSSDFRMRLAENLLVKFYFKENQRLFGQEISGVSL